MLHRTRMPSGIRISIRVSSILQNDQECTTVQQQRCEDRPVPKQESWTHNIKILELWVNFDHEWGLQAYFKPLLYFIQNAQCGLGLLPYFARNAMWWWSSSAALWQHSSVTLSTRDNATWYMTPSKWWRLSWHLKYYVCMES